MNSHVLPAKLYKYRPFSTTTLRMFTEAEVFFARPCTFNDPFDCNPQVHADVEWREVECLWKVVVLKQMTKARMIRAMERHRHNATEHGKHDDDGNGTDRYIQFMISDIDAYLKAQFKDHGVLSMARSWDNPLMWSHYADEHRGICIEYETDDHRCTTLGPVDYRSSRFIHISDLHQWLVNDSSEAKRKIFDQYFFAKAPQWRYEREWRAVARKNGVQDRPFNLHAVHFGLRCDVAIVTTIAKLFDDLRTAPKFYRLTPRVDGFKLGRYQLDGAEIAMFGMRESEHFAVDAFEFDPLTATGKISGRQLV